MTRADAKRATQTAPAQHGTKPEIVFRAMWPSEVVVSLVREQDALYRGVVRVDAAPTAVVIAKRGDGPTTSYRAEVHAAARNRARGGCAEHVSVERAIQEAYTELLRHTVESHVQPAPCACAA